MLSLSFLRAKLTGEINGITDVKEQISESAGGYDGIISLIQTKGISPAIVLENSEVGEFNVLPGGFLRTSQSIWIMKMVGRDSDRNIVQRECFSMMKKAISVFIKNKKSEELSNWDWESIPWGVRNAGANFTGYEFTVHFKEDTDLSYHG